MISRIVVADDDPSAREGLRALLTAWGYEVGTASDGRAALDMVSAVRPKIVITDLVMPSMTGLELLTVLHEQEPELPVILLTSHGHLDMHVDATQQGAYAYLRKPVDVATLKTVLASALASPAESEQDPLEVMTMRKHVVRLVTDDSPLPDRDWLDLERLAHVEVTSEDPAHPIESALVPGAEAGWRAAQPGRQTIRLIFDRPQGLRRIWLLFIEPDMARTQEFALSWSPDRGQSFRHILRQQWNFSSPGAIREVEDYHVELSGVTQLALTIDPDQRGGEARASLAQWRLA